MSNWEKNQEKVPEKQSAWGSQGTSAAGEGGQKDSGKSVGPSHINPQNQKIACEKCGLFNHNTKDCRRSTCEICGFSNHSTFECKNCLAWNYGPKLCATQVEDQSFFFIDEYIDSRVAREKACTVVMTVVTGSVNAKQIEHKFMNLIGATSWRWIAKPVGEGKFTMRFPIEKMAQEWSFLQNLNMRNGAQIKIEAWSPVGAKGVLQTAWFRVKKIPADQRSILTLAKVGGLVGKVMEIDEESRFRYDYVRLKIACRDVSKVPKTAEGTLGLYIFDFEFEREIPDGKGERMLKSGIKVGEDAQPPQKRPKVMKKMGIKNLIKIP